MEICKILSKKMNIFLKYFIVLRIINTYTETINFKFCSLHIFKSLEIFNITDYNVLSMNDV